MNLCASCKKPAPWGHTRCQHCAAGLPPPPASRRRLEERVRRRESGLPASPLEKHLRRSTEREALIEDLLEIRHDLG